ncbi:hypothetical protein MKZ38_010420 [Zalerion maritima]|uniref:Uncharacterized protein n=1 Tax=Zalerion maritima TaxID=339359 RepID=A0AAD5RG95_9PEZI|nr:hypothetical protein MKZ38_010420 [Zalerion maritima]
MPASAIKIDENHGRYNQLKMNAAPGLNAGGFLNKTGGLPLWLNVTQASRTNGVQSRDLSRPRNTPQGQDFMKLGYILLPEQSQVQSLLSGMPRPAGNIGICEIPSTLGFSGPLDLSVAQQAGPGIKVSISTGRGVKSRRFEPEIELSADCTVLGTGLHIEVETVATLVEARGCCPRVRK